MRLFRRKEKSSDPVELRLRPAIDLIYDLDRAEFNRLIDGVKLVFDGLQKFRKVKTMDEKENGDPDIDQMEKILEKEVKKETKKKESKNERKS